MVPDLEHQARRRHRALGLNKAQMSTKTRNILLLSLQGIRVKIETEKRVFMFQLFSFLLSIKQPPLHQECLHIVNREALNLIPVLLLEHLEELLRVRLVQAQSKVSVVSERLERLPEGRVGVGETVAEGRGDDGAGGGGGGGEGGESVRDLGDGLVAGFVVVSLPDNGELRGLETGAQWAAGRGEEVGG